MKARDLNATVQFTDTTNKRVLLVLQDGEFMLTGRVPAECRQDVIRRLVAWDARLTRLENDEKAS